MAAWFARVSNKAAALTGHYVTFVVAFLVIIVWAISGPLFGFSDSWQLIINTFTTLVTFLMVFLIQNTQNRDARAVHLKLDELIRAMANADNTMIQAEDDTDEELAELKRKYESLCAEHQEIKTRLGQAENAPQPTTNGQFAKAPR